MSHSDKGVPVSGEKDVFDLSKTEGLTMSAMLTTTIIHYSLFITHYSLNKNGGQELTYTAKVCRVLFLFALAGPALLFATAQKVTKKTEMI